MRWDRIIQTIEEQGLQYATWGVPEIQLDDEICGVKVVKNDKVILSIICHAGSYGGREGLFETMPAIRKEDYDVSGFLTEDEVIEAIKAKNS